MSADSIKATSTVTGVAGLHLPKAMNQSPKEIAAKIVGDTAYSYIGPDDIDRIERRIVQAIDQRDREHATQLAEVQRLPNPVFQKMHQANVDILEQCEIAEKRLRECLEIMDRMRWGTGLSPLIDLLSEDWARELLAEGSGGA